jgi:hypothetical protein
MPLLAFAAPTHRCHLPLLKSPLLCGRPSRTTTGAVSTPLVATKRLSSQKIEPRFGGVFFCSDECLTEDSSTA